MSESKTEHMVAGQGNWGPALMSSTNNAASKRKPRNIIFRLLGPGLVTGAADDDPNAPSLATLERAWKEEGARAAILDPGCTFQRVGWRPWAWWRFELSAAQKAAGEASGLETQAELLMHLGLCQRNERRAILARGGAVIDEQSGG
jgi:hypothetical protein